MNDNELLSVMIYTWLETKYKSFTDDLYYLEKSHWSDGYDIFATYEALEGKIRFDTYKQLRSELLIILKLYGFDSTK